MSLPEELTLPENDTENDVGLPDLNGDEAPEVEIAEEENLPQVFADAVDFTENLPSAEELDVEATTEKLITETVVFELHVGKPGFLKSIKAEKFLESAQAEAPQLDGNKKTNPKFLHVNQDIINRKELNAINNCDENFKLWLTGYKLQASHLASGLYLMPVSLVSKVDEKVEEYVAKREGLIDSFGAIYYKLQQDAKEDRGPHYDEADYPPFEEVRKRFTIDARYITLNVPKSLEAVNSEIYQKEKEKSKLFWADASMEIRNALRATALQLLKHGHERLGVDAATGKKRVFHVSSINKLTEFLDLFYNRDLTNDKELRSLIDQAKSLISGVDPQAIRSDDAFRATLEKGFENILKQADGMVVDQDRVFSYEEE